MTAIDSHQHFWDPAQAYYPWMTAAVQPLCRRFGPEDLFPLLQASGIQRSIAVQARGDLDETRELLAIAASAPFVTGVVGWVDLSSDDVGDTLDSLLSSPHGHFLVGLRHQVEEEPDPDWLRRGPVLRGLREVGKRDLAYDLLVRPHQLGTAIQVVRSLPALTFVLDHIAKPPIASGGWQPWADDIRQLAQAPNVWCKLSGMMTEADIAWSPGQLAPYVDCVLGAFGASRTMFGSDWPVSTLRGTYAEVFSGTKQALPALSGDEHEKIFGLNAAQAYRRLVPGP